MLIFFFLAATSDAENKDEEKQKAGHNSNVGYQANWRSFKGVH